MKEAMYKRYANQKPVGAAYISGTFGLRFTNLMKMINTIVIMYAVGTMAKMSRVFINIWYTTQLLVELLSEKVL